MHYQDVIVYCQCVSVMGYTTDGYTSISLGLLRSRHFNLVLFSKSQSDDGLGMTLLFHPYWAKMKMKLKLKLTAV
jgi:hypothetical protein